MPNHRRNAKQVLRCAWQSGHALADALSNVPGNVLVFLFLIRFVLSGIIPKRERPTDQKERHASPTLKYPLDYLGGRWPITNQFGYQQAGLIFCQLTDRDSAGQPVAGEVRKHGMQWMMKIEVGVAVGAQHY
jgi:hypothetical protein